MKVVGKFLVLGSLTFSGLVMAALNTQYLLNNPFSIKASKTLESKNNRYGVDNLKDLDIKTAWCAGGQGMNYNLTYSTTDSEQINTDMLTFNILPGYTKSESVYKANMRPKDVFVTVYGKDGSKIKYTSYVVADKMEFQQFQIPLGAEYILQDLQVKFEIVTVYLGEKYTDLCISELSVVPDVNMSYMEWEASQVAELETKVIAGDAVALHKVLRLFYGEYSRSAEGGEWISEIVLEAFRHHPQLLFTLLDVQEKSLAEYIYKNSIKSPINDKYSNTELLNAALLAKKSGVKSKYLDDFIEYYQDLVKKFP